MPVVEGLQKRNAGRNKTKTKAVSDKWFVFCSGARERVIERTVGGIRGLKGLEIVPGAGLDGC